MYKHTCAHIEMHDCGLEGQEFRFCGGEPRLRACEFVNVVPENPIVTQRRVLPHENGDSGMQWDMNSKNEWDVQRRGKASIRKNRMGHSGV